MLARWQSKLHSQFILSLEWYEVVTGLKIVQKAQENVILAERSFVESQEQRRATQSHLNGITAKRRELSAELDKVGRGEEKFLRLVTEEHKLIREEGAVRTDLEAQEARERSCFSLLSASLRDSHEKERLQMEKTKYWSLAASLVGAGLGVLVSTMNNVRRTRDLRMALGEVSRLEGSFREHALTLESNSSELRQLLERFREDERARDDERARETERARERERARESERAREGEIEIAKESFGIESEAPAVLVESKSDALRLRNFAIGAAVGVVAGLVVQLLNK